MRAHISDTLTTAIGSALTRAGKLSNTDIFADLIFIELASDGPSHMAHILAKYIKEWEIHWIRTSVEKAVAAKPPTPGQRIDGKALLSELNTLLTATLAKWGMEEMHVINSGHFLLWLLEDGRSAAARTMQLYGIDAPTAAAYVMDLPDREDYYDDIERLGQMADRMAGDTDVYADEQKATTRDPLDDLGVNLNVLARAGRLDAVEGREAETMRLIQILSRRRKSNPVLIGEAGVGKSAIVEGLAQRIVAGDVPSRLKDKEIFSLDVGALVSGTRYRGDFEARIKTLIDRLADDDRLILFIDELHNIVGAGSSQGTMDAANLLKAELARGRIKCIGATTLDEYRTHIERDSALERRFCKIMVEQLSPAQTLDVLRRLKPRYERHHRVSYSDEALAACVSLAGRYLPGRRFPDKAIDLLDESGVLARLRAGDDRAVEVGANHAAEVITLMTGIPAADVSPGNRDDLCTLADRLQESVIGQERAVDRVVRAICRRHAGLSDPSRPLGVFLFVGPTGVGKTHLAKELSRALFHNDEALIRIDMSEYAEKHSISRITGSPPGYVGHGEGGQLTESVRRRPYSVVLLDEIEKAHPELLGLMLQIFDEGCLTDSMGRKTDFRNTLIIMTSNIGAQEAGRNSAPIGYGNRFDGTTTEGHYLRAIEARFAPEFINRMDDIVIFDTLESRHIDRIAEIELGKLSARARKLGFDIAITDAAKRRLIAEGYRPGYGVRSLRRAILEKIEEPLADMIVEGRIAKGSGITIGVTAGKIGVKYRVPA